MAPAPISTIASPARSSRWLDDEPLVVEASLLSGPAGAGDGEPETGLVANSESLGRGTALSDGAALADAFVDGVGVAAVAAKTSLTVELSAMSLLQA